uniref:Non-homologous end-joining factor 1 n=1 Tax=Timema shepardi TaxID=629360 RepID=A0A7R9AKD9_TIMSH|nr:unnamed protein product [Timema shepardi]
MWRVLNVLESTSNNRENYIIKKISSETNHSIFLSNLSSIWHENLTIETLLERCKELNPCIDANTPEKLVLHVLSLVDGSRKDVETILTVLRDNMCIIKLNSKLAGVLFTYEFYLEILKGDMLYKELMSPVYMMLLELQSRQQLLINLLKKKDTEITEYKMNGAQLSRKNIETQLFNEQEFLAKCSETTFSPEIMLDPIQHVFTQETRNLYSDIINKLDRTKNKQSSGKVKATDENMEKNDVIEANCVTEEETLLTINKQSPEKRKVNNEPQLEIKAEPNEETSIKPNVSSFREETLQIKKRKPIQRVKLLL